MRIKSAKNVWGFRAHTFFHFYCAISAPRPSPDTMFAQFCKSGFIIFICFRPSLGFPPDLRVDGRSRPWDKTVSYEALGRSGNGIVGFSNPAGFWTGSKPIQSGGALRAPPFWMGFETIQSRLDPTNRQFPVRKPAGFENPTITFPDLIDL